jgi:hypothetical protein
LKIIEFQHFCQCYSLLKATHATVYVQQGLALTAHRIFDCPALGCEDPACTAKPRQFLAFFRLKGAMYVKGSVKTLV